MDIVRILSDISCFNSDIVLVFFVILLSAGVIHITSLKGMVTLVNVRVCSYVLHVSKYFASRLNATSLSSSGFPSNDVSDLTIVGLSKYCLFLMNAQNASISLFMFRLAAYKISRLSHLVGELSSPLVDIGPHGYSKWPILHRRNFRCPGLYYLFTISSLNSATSFIGGWHIRCKPSCRENTDFIISAITGLAGNEHL